MVPPLSALSLASYHKEGTINTYQLKVNQFEPNVVSVLMTLLSEEAPLLDNRAPLFQSIGSINLIKIMVFIKLLKSIVSIFLSVSINQRLVPRLISLGRVYMHVQNDIHMRWCSDPHHRDFALAHHSSRHVNSSLRFKFISALGARLSLISLCSIVKSRLSLETGVAFPSASTRIYH